MLVNTAPQENHPLKSGMVLNQSSVNFSTKIITIEEHLCILDRVQSEDTATLKLAAEVMKQSKVTTATYVFKPGDQVWLEGTNVHTTHPKCNVIVGTFSTTCASLGLVVFKAGLVRNLLPMM